MANLDALLFPKDAQEDAKAGQDATALALMLGAADPKPRQPMGLMDALAQTWPARMAKSAYEAAKLPGDVYAGRVDPKSDEAIGKAFDLAGLVTLGAGAVPSHGELRAGITAYHGSPKLDLTELVPSQRGPLGPGVYLSPMEQVAKQYAGPEGRIYAKELEDSHLFQGIKSRDSSINSYQVWRDQTARLVKAAPEELRQPIAELAGRMDPSDGYPFFARLSQLVGGQEQAQKLLKDAGYKGMTGIVDGPEIVHFGPLRLNGPAPRT